MMFRNTGFALVWLLGLSASLGRELLQGISSGLSVSYVPEFPRYPIKRVDFSHVITLQAPKAIKRGARAPIALTAVLDRSGSMFGEKMDLVKKSTEFLIQQLQEGDAVGIVSYASDVTEDVPMTPITKASQARARGNVREISANGGTNLSGGLFKGLAQQLQYESPPKSVNTVLLLTDGHANEGMTDINEITRKMGEDLGRPDAPIVYSLGFGPNHDAKFLRRISTTGEGSYVFIEDENAVAPSFGEILGGLLTTTAQDIEVTLKPENRASIVSVRGGEVSPGRNVWITRFKDLFAEEKRDILINMNLPSAPRNKKSQLVLTATVSFFDVAAEKVVEEKISVVLVRKRGKRRFKPAAIVEVTRLRHEAAEAIAQAVTIKEAGDTEGATSILDTTLTTLTSSSARRSPDVQGLVTDVQRVKDEVSAPQELTQSASIAITSGASTLKRQRRSGTSAAGFSSSISSTSSEAAFADAGQAFVSPGGGR